MLITKAQYAATLIQQWWRSYRELKCQYTGKVVCRFCGRDKCSCSHATQYHWLKQYRLHCQNASGIHLYCSLCQEFGCRHSDAAKRYWNEERPKQVIDIVLRYNELKWRSAIKIQHWWKTVTKLRHQRQRRSRQLRNIWEKI